MMPDWALEGETLLEYIIISQRPSAARLGPAGTECWDVFTSTLTVCVDCVCLPQVP